MRCTLQTTHGKASHRSAGRTEKSSGFGVRAQLRASEGLAKKKLSERGAAINADLPNTTRKRRDRTARTDARGNPAGSCRRTGRRARSCVRVRGRPEGRGPRGRADSIRRSPQPPLQPPQPVLSWVVSVDSLAATSLAPSLVAFGDLPVASLLAMPSSVAWPEAPPGLRACLRSGCWPPAAGPSKPRARARRPALGRPPPARGNPTPARRLSPGESRLLGSAPQACPSRCPKLAAPPA